MSTQNFYYNNMLVAQEVEDDFDFECAIDNAKSVLEAKFPAGSMANEWEENGLRSYPGKVIFTIPVDDRKGNHACDVQVIARSGYYSGVNFDWSVTDLYDDVTESAKKYIDAKVDSITRRIENVAPDFGTKLTRLGVFSNGEAIYEVAK